MRRLRPSLTVPRCLRSFVSLAGGLRRSLGITQLSIFLGLAISLFPAVASAQTPDLYMMMRSMTDRELLVNAGGQVALEAPVKKFVAAVFAEHRVTAEDIEFAVAHNDEAACAARPERPRIDPVNCTPLMDQVRALAKRESDIRAFGRDLQVIATGYEAPVQDFSTDQLNLPLRAQSILRIWKAGAEPPATVSGALIRLVDMPPTAVPALRDLQTALQKLRGDGSDTDQYHGAVWRYAYGYRFVRGDYAPQFPPTDERPGPFNHDRQFLYARWDEIEAALEAIADALPAPDALDPPLQPGESAVFVPPLDPPLREEFADINLAPWATLERTESEVKRDAGLQWIYAIQPVLPSLCEEEIGAPPSGDCTPILAGAPAPEPVNGGGLCLGPLSRSGYLCRPTTAQGGADPCLENVPADPDHILLTRCTSRTTETQSVRGPDVCQDIDWRANDEVSQCTIAYSCTTRAPANRFPVMKRGTTIAVPMGGAELPYPYETLRLMTHAKQACELPEGSDPILQADPALRSTACCRLQGDAYRTACEAMQADGLFGSEYPTMQETMIVNGVPVNAVTCAAILTDAACRPITGTACNDVFTRDRTTEQVQDMKQSLVQQVRDRWYDTHAEDLQRNPAYGSCADIVKGDQGVTKDKRIAAWEQEVEQTGADVCTPNTVTQYQNTIGNNLCYLGQCVEQSIENHRLVPGRQPMTSGDGAYPLDACMAPSNDAGILLALPPDTSVSLPPYRPELLIRTLDTALCQTNGLPAASPPALCAFDIRRRILLPLQNTAETALNALTQPSQLTSATSGLQNIGEAVATRIGTDLYSDYLEESARSLSRVTQNAARLLERFTTVNFSRAMCPLNDATGEFLNGEFCSAIQP